jgi:exodeoxyribonuclease VII large subunit
MVMPSLSVEQKPELVFSPTDFVVIANQALEYAFGITHIEGELSNFRISKNKWVYFDLKDETAKVSCFASIYALPGPLQDGMIVRISGTPRLHPQFGFSVTVQNIVPAGEGSIKKAFELLKRKLAAEGLFDADRKRMLPSIPRTIALVTSAESAAYADFIKIVTARWPFVVVTVYDTQVQGESAPVQIADAIAKANTESTLADVLVATRGGGSADDLNAFNDERVVRALAASRIPTLVAIGHEIDESLAELTADVRASTPSNAAEMLVPDRTHEQAILTRAQSELSSKLNGIVGIKIADIAATRIRLQSELKNLIGQSEAWLESRRELLAAYNPENVIKRGYAVVSKQGAVQTSIADIHAKDTVTVALQDGQFDATVQTVRAKL